MNSLELLPLLEVSLKLTKKMIYICLKVGILLKSMPFGRELIYIPGKLQSLKRRPKLSAIFRTQLLTVVANRF